jgi:hypothetical protein
MDGRIGWPTEGDKRRRQTKDEAGARLPKFALFRPCDAQQNTISQRKWGREVGEGGKLPILPVGRKKWTAIGGGVTGAAGGGLHERQALDQPYDARETNRLQKRIQELGDGREDRVAYRRR